MNENNNNNKKTQNKKKEWRNIVEDFCRCCSVQTNFEFSKKREKDKIKDYN